MDILFGDTAEDSKPNIKLSDFISIHNKYFKIIYLI